ncbi:MULTISPECIES: NUDIX domain-containing protein [unclassified Agrobacterium]|uniref:NUDIX domain-containing protein n=1 Tax=unclassified Agrobacterium TaxID=2632611 RepID=UPI00244CBF23|nr:MULTISPECIES: NUDIX domain-containing protein [unclassified Agrobacterium]MDH0613540.1 NUDIX domain-containing protein [Agrobacterium sp. GD03872]MDH0697457.1 NUDIX domain-containing protein [Agrobacterium sp. GD03871]MDH1059741.1 NUDIX domain-containing protein [Agrobacterium sp. GD03992]MDH2210322.1 NUDIX domain-containing protein [Agrobacterium sp. GD03643]MDH2219821.1 NUDIX domain-containing protein [Agrobacterium sp. GD03638]
MDKMTSTTRPGLDFPGVGVGLVIMRDGRVLLCRRMKAPEAGYWSIPGGKVDHLETSLAAARREAEEETGLEIGEVEFLCHSEFIDPEGRHHWISLIFVTRDTQGEPALTEPDKLSAIGWFDPEKLPAPLSAFAQDALAALK